VFEGGDVHSLALEKKAESLEPLGRYEEAIKCIDEAVSLESQNENYYSLGEYYGKKAELLNRLGRHEEALECIDEGIEKVNLAQAKDGKYFASSEHYEVLYHHLLPRKANALKQLGRYEEALECCEKGIDILNLVEWGDSGGQLKDFWNTKMESLEQLGRYEEAGKCRDKAGKEDFRDPKSLPRWKMLFWR
jgi:tetratricopeptide (TPR) repeat protein